MESVSGRGSRKTILIVDDDDLMQVFYKRLFSRHPDEFAYQAVRSAEDALQRLQTANVDVVILDWDLPGINGLQLLMALRANPSSKALPVIMVSGRTSPDYAALALRHGANVYLGKPFEIAVLLNHLRSFDK